jgi:hypothetical protein
MLARSKGKNICRPLNCHPGAKQSAQGGQSLRTTWRPRYIECDDQDVFSTSDDNTVPVGASVEFYQALIAAKVQAELHIFRHGGNGSGLGAGDAALDMWRLLLEQWMRDQGWLSPVRR